MQFIKLNDAERGFPVSENIKKVKIHIIIDDTCMSELSFSVSGQMN